MNQAVVWLNGEFLPLAQARVSPLDRGFLYGDGLFETLRAQDGRLPHLEDHLARLAFSAWDLNLAPLPDQDWPAILGQLLRLNQLEQGAARLKIVLSRGEAPGLGLPRPGQPTCLALAQAYAPPSPEQYAKGWRLATLEQGFAPPLARHKSLCYLFYLQARQAALEAGADEALILGPRGEVCEGAASSLLAHDGHTWLAPLSPWRLRGVTLGVLRQALARRGQSVSDRAMTLGQLRQARTVWALNSLMGVMPVASLDGQALPQLQAELAAEMRTEILA